MIIPSPKMILIGVLGVGILAFGMYGLKTYNQLKADEKARIQAIITLTENVAKEASRADNATSALNIAEATNANLEASLAAARVAQKKINTEFTAFRMKAATEEKVLDNSKFEKVFKGKPSIFIDKANAATKERFDEVARILDGN